MLTTSEFLSITNQLQKAYSTRMNQLAADNGMTKVEIDVLLFVYNNPQYNTAKEIVEFRHIAKSYVSKAVDLLVKRGYLSIQEDESDRRISRLLIKDEAKEVVEQARKAQESAMRILFQGITEEELDTFENIMRKMAENLNIDKQGGK
ncbi:MarR family transcriptional regulator [Faecalicatena sp. AGMB00832]|uniref:MarR family transcriptional regulator n=1 Tax=Faecalicatena faecalis TaxID=2726362 RepID=A0ABS6D3N3_9FIRM|nr:MULTISPECIES: MarR family transcriptional regulator [Faecalicatena]MBU3876135.1 MarR family transcriptional regulator [Faecalicatena faecalis]MCI6464054.1 MarR family transcriptional regulator [Faecalicatena sp.]MDY5619220.1 MarR family transcriptional regulator [Lachnospiraceae bacterium]